MTDIDLSSFPPGGAALVVGSSGAIGAAAADLLQGSGRFDRVLRFGRSGDQPIDITEEASVAAAAKAVGDSGLELRLVFDATGVLHGDGMTPEKSYRAIDPAAMARAFAVNAIGPALLIKHLLPLLPRRGKAVFATLSAKVGGIADNRLGGWMSYRASKAALNQIVRTAAIELGRRHPEALCVALHPGTTESPLSAPFSKSGLTVRPPEEAAALLLRAIDGLGAADNGGFFSYDGRPLPW